MYDVSSSHRWPSRVNTVYHISYGCVSLTFFIRKDTSKKVSDHTYWLYMSRPSPFLDITISINQQNLPLQSTTNKKQPVFANISLSYSVRARIWCKDSCHWSLYWEFCFVQQSRTETHDFCNLEMLCELPAVYGAETFVVSSRCKCLQWLEGHLFRGGWIMTEEEAHISFEMHGWFYSQISDVPVEFEFICAILAHQNMPCSFL